MPGLKRKKQIPVKRVPWVTAAGFQDVYHPALLLSPKNRANPPPKVSQFSGKEFCSPDGSISSVPQQSLVLPSQGSDAPHPPPTPALPKEMPKAFFLAGPSRGGGSTLGLGLFAQSALFLTGFCRARSRSCPPPRREAVGRGRVLLRPCRGKKKYS